MISRITQFARSVTANIIKDIQKDFLDAPIVTVFKKSRLMYHLTSLRPRKLLSCEREMNMAGFGRSLRDTVLLILSYIVACHVTAAFGYLIDLMVDGSATFEVSHNFVAAAIGYIIITGISCCVCIISSHKDQ